MGEPETVEKDPVTVVREILAEALLRDPNTLRKGVALGDGNEAQLALLKNLTDEAESK